jgi:hypothetical protein
MRTLPERIFWNCHPRPVKDVDAEGRVDSTRRRDVPNMESLSALKLFGSGESFVGRRPA